MDLYTHLKNNITGYIKLHRARSEAASLCEAEKMESFLATTQKRAP
jgi:hypothetical protein